jgi:hypothetical protein
MDHQCIVLIYSLVSQRAVDSDDAESSGMNSFYVLFNFLQHLKNLTCIPLCQ